MYYYEILVADSSYKGTAALTYQYHDVLPRGSVVSAPIKSRQSLGVVSRAVGRPSFATKPLSRPEQLPPLPEQLVDLAGWLSAYYPSGIGVSLQQFLPSKLYGRDSLVPYATSTSPADRTQDIPGLTTEQQAAVQKMSQPGTHLLHGETGSGKTRVYIELVRRGFEHNRSSIVLTPEIGLTPQLTRNFVQAFGADRVLTTHSKLTAKERNLLWLRMLTDTADGPEYRPLVVLGPRSALFSPLRNVGTIILDESHESSYKQEQAPHYQSGMVAAKLADLHQAVLVLGSATPSITDYYLATARQRPIIRMTAKARKLAAAEEHAADGAAADVASPAADGARDDQSDDVSIQLVDLKDRTMFGRQPHLSKPLIDSIQTSLQAGEQSLVFLNRRGTARIILCETCGWQSLCPHCDLPLTYHGDRHDVRCHTCGYVHQAPNSCPECGSAEIILKSIGTKAIVQELENAFPQARIQRFDTDNTKDERLELHYDAVRAGDVDIIVGTQLIAKGLDLPLLSTVGVVVADTSLYLPDYSSGERSYQLLRQVIGRVGRGHIRRSGPDTAPTGRVIIQTYDPASPVIQAAAKGDWQAFYDTELAERQAFMFPPFCHTLKIWCRRATSKAAQGAAEKCVGLLRSSGLRVIIDGPTPAFYEKTAGKFQWQATLKAKDRRQLIEAIRLLPANWSYDIDPSNLL